MSQHIFTGTAAPATTPTAVGQHFIDTTNKIAYVSVGTSSSSDWIVSETLIATPSEVNAGTDNAKAITPYAIQNSTYIKPLTTFITTTGGTTTLTAAQNKSTAIEVTGTLASNAIIIVANTMAPFVVENNTTGAYTLTFKTLSGAGATVTSGNLVILYADGTDCEALTSGSTPAWGSITGTLSTQTDLQTALNAKAPIASPTFTGTVGGITATMVGAPSGSGTSSGTNTGDQTNISGNAATVTTNANLTGPVTSVGNATSVANLAITNAMIAASTIDLTAKVTGVLPIANGGTNNSSAYTSGSVPYSDGTKITQDNLHLSYDATNKRLTVGTNSPINTLSVMKDFYSTGTASQSGTTVTGSGTSWDNTSVGGRFIFANGVDSGTISAVTDATHLTVSTSQTVGSQAYAIKSMGLQVTGKVQGSGASAGLVGIGTDTPGDTLHIKTDSDGWTEILFDAASIPAGAGGPGGTWNIGTGYSGYGNIKNFYIDDAANGAGTAAFLIDANGNVGLTNMTPTARLDVNGYIRSTGNSVTTGTFTKTSDTALAAITELSATVSSGKTYQYEIELETTSGTSGGIKVDLNGGSATMTSITGMALAFSGAAISTNTRVAALTTSLCAVTAVSAATCRITGSFVVNAGGTFIPRFAQNASNGTSSTVVIGSYMKLTQIT